MSKPKKDDQPEIRQREHQEQGKGSVVKKMSPIAAFFVALLIVIGQILFGVGNHTLDMDEIPAWSGEAFAVVREGQPSFRQQDLVTTSYEYYAPLDDLGRCGVTMACIGRDLMPKEDRGDISQVKPSGWVQNFYDFVDGEALYNRCHLIGFQLAGENANECNLITGTRYMNVEGMLPFENMIADYVKETGNHVIYRVTPIFVGEELVARGVQMEAWSVEDGGDGICFHVFCYNVQPGVKINYATGENKLSKSK